MGDCLLCSSPVPSSQEDANYAYVAGVADGIALCVANYHVPLCETHRAKLQEVLAEVHDVGAELTRTKCGGLTLPTFSGIEPLDCCGATRDEKSTRH